MIQQKYTYYLLLTFILLAVYSNVSDLWAQSENGVAVQYADGTRESTLNVNSALSSIVGAYKADFIMKSAATNLRIRLLRPSNKLPQQITPVIIVLYADDQRGVQLRRMGSKPIETPIPPIATSAIQAATSTRRADVTQVLPTTNTPVVVSTSIAKIIITPSVMPAETVSLTRTQEPETLPRGIVQIIVIGIISLISLLAVGVAIRGIYEKYLKNPHGCIILMIVLIALIAIIIGSWLQNNSIQPYIEQFVRFLISQLESNGNP